MAERATWWEYCDYLVTEVTGQARPEDESPAERSDEEDLLAEQDAERSAIARAGEEGWELVSVVPLLIEGTTHAERYVFKRPRQ